MIQTRLELSLELDKIVLQLWSVLDCILQYTLVKWRMRHSGETTFYFCTVLNPFHDNQMMIWLHIQVSFWDFKMIEWLWQYLEPTQRWLTTQKRFPLSPHKGGQIRSCCEMLSLCMCWHTSSVSSVPATWELSHTCPPPSLWHSPRYFTPCSCY